MKRHLAIVLLVMYISALIPVSEWAKLPFLWEHYQEHKMSDADMGFFEFINHHYDHSDQVYPDAEKDMKLPFKSQQHQHLMVSPSVLPKGDLQMIIFPYSEREFSSRAFYFQSTWISLFVGDSWQPPKISAYYC